MKKSTPPYIIRRLLASMGDGVCLEPLISIARQMLEPEADLWLHAEENISTLYQHHPALNRIVTASEAVPPDARLILDIKDTGECPSIQSLRKGDKINATQLFCDAAHLNGKPIEYDGRAPKLYFSTPEKAWINSLKRCFPMPKIAIQVKGGHPWKFYPYLKELINMIQRKIAHAVIFVTHDADLPFNIPGVIPLIRLPFRELMRMLGVVDIMIGVDSGPTHLAAAVGTQTYGIFGPTDPEEILGMYGTHVSWNDFPLKKCPNPRCWLSPCEKLLCLRVLHPKRIFANVRQLINSHYINPALQVGAAEEAWERWINPLEFATVPEVQDEVEIVAPKTKKTPSSESPSLMRLDGLGGTLTLSDTAAKVFAKTGQKVTLITRGYEILFEDNPHVKEVINVGMRDWKEVSLVMRNQYTPLAEIRFGIGTWFSNNGNYASPMPELKRMFTQFPQDFNTLEKYGLHHIQLANRTLGLPFDSIESRVFVDEKIEPPEKDFIVINNGVDVIHGSMRQTKCWDGWNLLSQKTPFKCLQVGTLNDPLVPNAIDLRGKTSIKELIYLLKIARAIVVGEGGIMHLAFAAGAQNVIVLGGPTQGCLFEYPGHTWVCSYVCGNCWSTTPDWYQKCPKNCDAVCMQTISPQRVNNTVLEVINETLVSD